VSTDAARDLAAPSRVTDVNGVSKVEMAGQGGQVVGVVIHVVSAAGLRGPVVPAPVGRDDPVPVAHEEHELRVPVVSRMRPTVTEDDGLAEPQSLQ
jgi:hypothetical protein